MNGDFQERFEDLRRILSARKAILTSEDTLFMEGLLEHDDYEEIPDEVGVMITPDGTEGGTLRFYLVPVWDVMKADYELEAGSR